MTDHNLVMVDKDRLKKLEEGFEDLASLINNAPEINMNNYNEDDVFELNNAMLEIFNLSCDLQKEIIK